MKSFATADFRQAYAKLSPKMKEQARKAYQLWQESPPAPTSRSGPEGIIWGAQEWI